MPRLTAIRAAAVALSLLLPALPAAADDGIVRVKSSFAGQVWAVYSDFHWIALRHGIRDRDQEFATATKVISSITASVAKQ